MAESRDPRDPALRLVANNEESSPDPFDPASLRLPQEFGSELGVQKVLTTIRVRRPDRHTFIRTHPKLQLQVALIELREVDETYLVAPSMYTEIGQELLKPATLFLAINRQAVPFFWPIRLPDETGRWDEWSRSAHDGAQLAFTQWVSVRANRAAGAYDVLVANGKIPDPDWSRAVQDKPLSALLELAFRDGKLIDRPDHPVILQLQGRV